jgi:type III restriction enzyme
MTSFYDRPILNSPYLEPTLHHALDNDGQPLDGDPMAGRRRSEFITPVPKSKKQKKAGKQGGLLFQDTDGVSTDQQEYNPTPIINEIRSYVSSWRKLPNPNDWKVSPTTARLLRHWREHEFQDIRPFFCQVEAVETIIWLTEVARTNPSYKKYWDHVRGANEQANPELLRLAMKMATGAGKTTVMAMLIAWQTLNFARLKNSKLFTRGFLIIAPGITIRDRLQVLQPNDPNSYYQSRELVPTDMLDELHQAKIVITNYHAFQLRETDDGNKISRGLRQGRGPELDTKENEGQMVRRVANALMGEKNIIVINDEAHHCYREKPGDHNLDDLKGDDRKEAKDQNEYARVWINGIEAVKRKLGVRSVYDLSATPFFLKGSGYIEGTLFPWTVSDFGLMDAIECGIVKLPRVPVADNIPNEDAPVFRNIWDHIGKDMPKKGRGKAGASSNPEDLPDKLKTALHALYDHYVKVDSEWKKSGIDVPPVFIVVCNNTSTSELVAEWISGWTRPNEDGEELWKHGGNLELFSNFDKHGTRLTNPNTLLIDSYQIESGGDLDANFRKAMEPQIEQFKRERNQRANDMIGGDISDAELLREVMNTIGRKGRLGEQIRCVVSVSMLTEGWDTNTVTHILGVRAFGSQLLCEQVVGRGLRRYSYALNEQGLFDVEYADVLGIPFDFTAKPIVAKPTAPPKTQRVEALKERAALEITYPRVTGYRIEMPEEQLTTTFTENSSLRIDPSMVGPGETLLQGIVGEGVTLTVKDAQNKRPSSIAFDLAKRLMITRFKDKDGEPKLYLFGQLKRICRRWLDEGYLDCAGETDKWMLSYDSIGEQACERIYNAIALSLGVEDRVKAVLDPYNPKGSTRFVGFNTSKDVYRTDPRKCHVNNVALDSDWEAEFARVAEDHGRVLKYAKNQNVGLEIPYRDGGVPRHYIPDFIAVLDDGNGPDDPLNLIVEVKGYRAENVKLKSETMNAKWVPGVNALSTYGRWAFVEFGDVFDMGSAFRKVIDEAVEGKR